MRKLLAAFASAIHAALCVPLEFLEALYDALRRKPVTDAVDHALAELEQAVEQAQAASVQPEQSSDLTTTLEAEVRGALAFCVVNARRSSARQPPIAGPAVSEPRLAEWTTRLDAVQAQRVLNATGARPGALQSHLDGSARILGVPAILSLDSYREMAVADAAIALDVEPPANAKMAI